MTDKMQQGPTRRLAEWAATVPRTRTATARPQAVEGFRDLLVCMIAGAPEATPQRAAETAKTLGLGNCTLVGQPPSIKVSAPWAAFANSVAAHYLDFDDSSEPLQGHPSVTLIPALLALAEARHATGAELLDAYTVGIEATAFVGRPNAGIYLRGWHATAVMGVISTAIACARLLKLDTDGIQNAISIAVSSASGHMGQNGYEVKCLQPAFAARDGLVAALLAAAGIKGSPEAFTGSIGLESLYGGTFESSENQYTLPSEDQELAIVNPGIIFKPYATCGSTHRSIDVCLEFIHQYDLRPEDVASVETLLPFSCARNLPYARPENGSQARFSVHYGIALAFVNRQIVLGDFEGDTWLRPDIQAFLPKVTMKPVPGSETNTGTYLDIPVTTTITLTSGEMLTETRYERKGDRRRPLSDVDWDIKISDCLGRAYDSVKSADILAAINRIGELDDAGELMRLLVKA